MSLFLNTNIEAFTAQRNLSSTTNALATSMQRISSGFRINSAADDAAGLSISERLRSQISGLQQGQRNSQDGISMMQTADGALDDITSILHRVRDLAVEYQNGTYSASDKAAITAEVTQLNAQIQNEIGNAQFNGIGLLGAGAVLATIQAGANGADQVGVAGFNATTAIGAAVSAFAGGVANITNIDTAITNISAGRGQFGAIQNRLEDTVNFMSTQQGSIMQAESNIRNTDFASEITNMTRLQILQQSGTAMLAQANQHPQTLLSLLKGN